MKIRKAVIPVAGFGTRFLPATKAQPKEMLTLVDKPVIQYVVEEAVAAGIEEIIFVTSQTKRAIEDHFDRNFELEYRLGQKGKTKELDQLRKISDLAKFAFVRQQTPKGDGHAILSALPFVDPHEPVAVLFGDDVFDSNVPVTAQLIATYEKYHDPVIALYDVGRKNVSSYGIASGTSVSKNVMELNGFVEKPAVDKAPSSFAAVGRYIITPAIMEILKTQTPGKDGEIRLADAFITHLGQGSPIYGKIVEGTRYDCGNKLQFLIASVDYGLKHKEANDGGAFLRFLKKRVGSAGRRK
ncbi:MAG TPA: UTP--glucose-1-phosphate uridylyltransferase [Candidatus Eisenbacteria bacterium]|nr:UTP--glucose-1-phosphate uridylyltransferase [Candidatus Eisenbacteria bacterium]